MGAAILARREELGISRSKCAGKFGCTRQRWEHWEVGTTRVPADDVPMIAEVLEITVSALYKRALHH